MESPTESIPRDPIQLLLRELPIHTKNEVKKGKAI